MALQNIPGSGFWVPLLIEGISGDNAISANDATLVDADEEEIQVIGRVKIDGGGSKTFGTSGSKVSWLPGAGTVFLTGSTLRVGVKKAASVDFANGPPARATIGAAAFDVYNDLVGGTDTITATTWRDDAMAAGTPFTVTHGDLIAICLHLDTASGTPTVRMRGGTILNQSLLPSITLVTSGPTYTAQSRAPNFILTFDDGTLGWLEGSLPFSAADTPSATIGNGNIFGNIFQFPFNCKVDALSALVVTVAGSDFNLELYSTPLGTPSLIEAVSVDSNTLGTTMGIVHAPLVTPRTLTINTDYAVGIKQTTANVVTAYQRDQNSAAYFKPLGLGAECYAANSTAGATFVAQNSGKRRYHIWVRISALDDGVSAGGVNRALLPSGVSAMG